MKDSYTYSYDMTRDFLKLGKLQMCLNQQAIIFLMMSSRGKCICVQSLATFSHTRSLLSLCLCVCIMS